jgi:hypothetical protein
MFIKLLKGKSKGPNILASHIRNTCSLCVTLFDTLNYVGNRLLQTQSFRFY